MHVIIETTTAIWTVVGLMHRDYHRRLQCCPGLTHAQVGGFVVSISSMHRHGFVVLVWCMHVCGSLWSQSPAIVWPQFHAGNTGEYGTGVGSLLASALLLCGTSKPAIVSIPLLCLHREYVLYLALTITGRLTAAFIIRLQYDCVTV